MWAWIVRIFGLLFGGDKQSATDQQLGRVEQQRADDIAAAKEDHRALEIDEEVDRMSSAQLDQQLRPPPDSSRPK